MYCAVTKLSDLLSSLERVLAYTIVIALPIMVLVNTAARAMRSPIYWMDELAILSMVWLAMLTMSLTLKSRDAVAVTMLLDVVSPSVLKVMKVAVDILTMVFGLVLLMLSYNWFDPLALARVGFNFQEFSGETFNFMYQETTTTLGLPKFWFWTIVPFSAFCTSVHALSNLLATLRTNTEQLSVDHHKRTPLGGE